MQAKATLFNAQQAHVVLQRLWLEVEGALVAGDQRLTLEIRPEKLRGGWTEISMTAFIIRLWLFMIHWKTTRKTLLKH